MIGTELIEVTFQYVCILHLLIIILIVDYLFLFIYINCKQRTSFRAVMVYILAVYCPVLPLSLLFHKLCLGCVFYRTNKKLYRQNQTVCY